jgi:hypothetical protein
VKPTEDLSDPGFGQKKEAEEEDENDGIVIIAPGAASPEDSFEAVGIESPFNWREQQRRSIAGPGEPGEGEAIELNAPETSVFQERVAVDDGGNDAAAAENYDLVERAGFILPPDEFRVDASVLRERNGRHIFGKGDVIYLQSGPGRQVYPGSIYTVFRDEGKVMGGDDKAEVGNLVRAVSEAKIIRVDSENIMARIERQYDTGKVGDILRLRDPDRARHYASLRQAAGEKPLPDLQGEIVELEQRRLIISTGQNVYLNIGRSQGVFAGMKLAVYRRLSRELDPTKIQPGPVGKIGELLVISTHKSSATAKMTRSDSAVSVGDRVRYR